MKSIFVNAERCVACKSCEIACALNRSSVTKRLPEAMYETPSPLSRVRVEDTGTENGFPVQCRHCEDAPCLDACPAKALYRDAGGWSSSTTSGASAAGCASWSVPSGRPSPSGAFEVIKCDQCTGMDAPFCVESCPTHALVLLDPEEIARGKVKLQKAGLTGLDFVSTKGLAKP